MSPAPRSGALCFGLAAALVVVTHGEPARARDAASVPTQQAPNEAPRRLVRVVVAGDDAEVASALDASLRELVARLDLTVETSRAERLDLDSPSALAESSGGELATAWVDLRETRATTAIVEGRTGRVVARRSVERDRSTAIVVEELAHIIHASVEELAEQEHHRAKPAPPPPPPPLPDPRVARESGRWGLDGGGFFGGRGFGTGAEAVVGGGGMLGVAHGRGALRPALWLMGTYHVAFDVRGTRVDVHTKAAALRLAPTLRLAGGSRWMLEAGPEVGFDVMWTQPRANSASLRTDRLGEESTDYSPVVGAIVAAHLGVSSGADLFIAVAADVDLSPHRFVISEGPETDALFVPWRVRPALLLGFTFTMAGSVPYAPAEGR